MMRQETGEASTAAEAQALAKEAIQSARAALREQQSLNGYTVVATGDRITITVPNEEGATRTIQLSSDGSRIVSVNGISTREIAPRKQIPGELIPMMAIIFGAVTVMSIFTPIVKAFARRYEKRGDLKQQALTDQRLAAIEQAIETVAVEVERISEGQRFTTKLLAEKQQPEMERVR